MAANKPKGPVMPQRRPGGVVVPAIVVPTIGRSTDHEQMQRALSTLPEATTVTTTPQAMPGERALGFQAAKLALEGEDFVIGQNYIIPHQRIIRSKNNARIYYTAADLEETTESLIQNKQLQPALGYVRDGKVVLTDGGKRLQASAMAGIYTLEVKIIPEPETEAEEYEQSRLINLHRSAQSGIDDAFKWKELLYRGVYRTQEELATRLGVKPPQVSKILGITRIPERLIKTMVEHPSTSGWAMAYAVSQIFEAKVVQERGAEECEKIAEEIVDMATKGDLSRSQVEALIKKRMDGPKTRLQPLTNAINYGGIAGTLKVFPQRGQLDLSFTGLAPEKVTELEELIKKALSEQKAN